MAKDLSQEISCLRGLLQGAGMSSADKGDKITTTVRAVKIFTRAPFLSLRF
jgi:hypothetical protein